MKEKLLVLGTMVALCCSCAGSSVLLLSLIHIFKKALYSLGETPLPHSIINRPVEPEDAERFQSIFAKNEGAVGGKCAEIAVLSRINYKYLSVSLAPYIKRRTSITSSITT